MDQGSNVAESRKSLVEDDQRDCINAVQHGRQAVKSSTHKAPFQTFNAAEQGLPIESVDLQVRLLVPKNQHEEADKRQAAESSINETTDIDWRYTIKVGFYRYKQLAGAVGYGSNFNKINELNDSRI
ncbi:MAG: hypothetical protein VXX85_02435 [Candidatus Margulisiibacteriota bacterium]|nr:hypothetical protein [Candidatus Margulisiibacteriota bacterium]